MICQRMERRLANRRAKGRCINLGLSCAGGGGTSGALLVKGPSHTMEPQIEAAGDIGQGGEIEMTEQFDLCGGQLVAKLMAGLGK